VFFSVVAAAVGHSGSGNDDVRLCRCGLLRARRVPGGVTAEAGLTGADLIDRAAAGCVLDDLCREAAWPGVESPGARVTAADLGGHRTGPVMPVPVPGDRAEAGRGRSGPGS